MEKMAGNGLIGNEYNPFPTKKRSRYVPKSDASSIAEIK